MISDDSEPARSLFEVCLNDAVLSADKRGNRWDAGQVSQHNIDDLPVFQVSLQLNFKCGEIGEQIFLGLSCHSVIPFKDIFDIFKNSLHRTSGKKRGFVSLRSLSQFFPDQSLEERVRKGFLRRFEDSCGTV